MPKRTGFTLLELLLVVIILGILASLGITQYTKVIEKSRAAEAKMVLGQMRTAQEARKLEYGNYTATFDDLGLSLTSGSCDGNHYFKYTTTLTEGKAERCLEAAPGKPPQGTGTGYNITMTYANSGWGGTAGYY